MSEVINRLCLKCGGSGVYGYGSYDKLYQPYTCDRCRGSGKEANQLASGQVGREGELADQAAGVFTGGSGAAPSQTTAPAFDDEDATEAQYEVMIKFIEELLEERNEARKLALRVARCGVHHASDCGYNECQPCDCASMWFMRTADEVLTQPWAEYPK